MIKVLFMFVGLLISMVGHSTASVPSLNQCPDMIFIDGIENDSVPSNGAGGSFPGSMSQTVPVPGLGNQTYHYYIPSSYQQNVAMPMMILWHGAAGAGQANNQALNMLNIWDDVAEDNQFIIVAQVATGSSGGWVPSNDIPILSTLLDDMEARYNVETSRIYGWGFSAGGHVWHALGLQNAEVFAAYAVNAGVLEAYAGVTTPLAAGRKIPVYVSVGSNDGLLSFAQNDRNTFTVIGWQENNNYWLDVFSGGHTIPSDAPSKAWDKICISTVLD